MLARWSENRAEIHLVMLRPVRQRAVSSAVVNEVLPHSQKVLLTLRDENGDGVGVTVSLEGAEWETGVGSTASISQENELSDFADITWLRFLAATFPNGNRYIFGERLPAQGVLR